MSLSSFNSYLLTKLVKNFRLGTDPRSLIKRHQTLSIIYANLSLMLMTIFYEVIGVALGTPYRNLPPKIIPFVAGSFLSLRKGKNDIAALFPLVYAHGVNSYVSHYCYSSLGAMGAIFMFPNFSFFMSSSSSVQIINTILCIGQVIGHIMRFKKIFAITMTLEQDDEINNLIATVVPCLSFLCFMLIAQKSVENGIWQAATLTQEKTEKINQEIMQAVEAKDAFISSLSHEIRNPLNAMNGSISYLFEVIKDPQCHQVLNNARISGETLLNLFNNLLDAAKMKSEKIELSYDDANLYETLKKLLIINCENLKQKRIFVDVLINRNIPQTIRSDSARILQILMNLISNSVKFTPENGKISIYATICVQGESKKQLENPINVIDSDESLMLRSRGLDESTQLTSNQDNGSSFFEEFSFEEAKTRCENLANMRTFKSKSFGRMTGGKEELHFRNKPWSIKKVNMDDDKQNSIDGSLLLSRQQSPEDIKDFFLKIQVTDTGCGIAQENIPKLFEIFTQAHRRITSSHGGTGLGLWICKQLCQKMGGDIKLYSEIGKGTTFVFYIPISNKETSQCLLLQPNAGEQQFQEKTSCLVVDDFSYNRDLYRLLLEREGVQVIVASDGEEAINKYLSNIGKLDFILMDVQMPKMDGFTAAKRIRELEVLNKWKRVDIYFVSGEYYNEEEVIASFKIHGGNAEALGIKCLKKPIDIEVMSKVAFKYTKKGR